MSVTLESLQAELDALSKEEKRKRIVSGLDIGDNIDYKSLTRSQRDLLRNMLAELSPSDYIKQGRIGFGKLLEQLLQQPEGLRTRELIMQSMDEYNTQSPGTGLDITVGSDGKLRYYTPSERKSKASDAASGSGEKLHQEVVKALVQKPETVTPGDAANTGENTDQKQTTGNTGTAGKNTDQKQTTGNTGTNRNSMRFGLAFADARRKGEQIFEWKGKKYTTKWASEV